jgi:uncharacterized membrane protein
METENQKGPNITKLTVALLLLILCVIFVVYEYGGVIYAQMMAFKLIPTSEQFTELYFTDPSAIPTSLQADQAISFQFTIHNLEGATTTYPYEAYFQDNSGNITILASNTVSLPNNESTTVAVSYSFPKSTTSNEQGKVIVDLPSHNNQQIDFFLPYSN